jgi:molecular chaperone GrpE
VRPEERDGKGTDESRPAGPVAGQGSPAHPPETPDPTPPAGEAFGEPPGSASQADARGLEEVEHDLDELLSQRDEYLDLAKRTKADFENYRRRMGADVLAATGRGKAEVLRDVLPVLDDLERAIQAAGLDPEGDSPDGLAHGVLLVFRSLRDSLVKNGVEAVDPTGERFDPQAHEALSMQAADGVESGTVVETMQKGYRLGEQLIRPARVVVAE